jgi:hypothetical protein
MADDPGKELVLSATERERLSDLASIFMPHAARNQLRRYPLHIG